jgi:hypothetical protein
MKKNVLKRIYTFYADGFRNMGVGRKLWAIILIKLFIMFAVFRVFFFKNYLNENFENDKQRGDYVLEQLTTPERQQTNDNK